MSYFSYQKRKTSDPILRVTHVQPLFEPSRIKHSIRLMIAKHRLSKSWQKTAFRYMALVMALAGLLSLLANSASTDVSHYQMVTRTRQQRANNSSLKVNGGSVLPYLNAYRTAETPQHQQQQQQPYYTPQSQRSLAAQQAAAAAAAARPNQLTRTQELAALVTFMTQDAHVLPANTNPDEPLDADLILEFDIRGESGAARAEDMEEEVWDLIPVVMFSKTSCPWASEAIRLLDSYKLDPAPLIIELEQRKDTRVLNRLVKRLTGHDTFPSTIVGGISLGGYDELLSLHRSGRLAQLFSRAGAEPGRNAAKRKIKPKQGGVAQVEKDMARHAAELEDFVEIVEV